MPQTPGRPQPPTGAESPAALEPPQPPPAVNPAQAHGLAPAVGAQKVPELDRRVESLVEDLVGAPAVSPDLAARTEEVRTMGDADIRRAAETSNRLLRTPVKALHSGALTPGSKVSQTLLHLRRTVEDLDPKAVAGRGRRPGLRPVGRRITDYFRRFHSAQSHLDAVLYALHDGQDELRRDNATLAEEKQQLWDTMAVLNQHVYVVERLDRRLSQEIDRIGERDPEHARHLREDVLFYVRQKHQDLLTQLAVSIQNYLALDVMIKNNLELVKGVDRASTTTVAALRTAVIAAQALNNQQLVLDQITALNTTTSQMIESTSQMLRDNSARIQQQATAASVELRNLQAAFQNIYLTMDAIDTFRTQALDTMTATVNTLRQEVDRSREYLERARGQAGTDGAAATGAAHRPVPPR